MIIAIIMVILAMLLPAMGESREAVLDAKCKNNLHQIFITMGGFRANNMGQSNDSLPGPHTWQTYVESLGAGAALRCPKDGGYGGPGSESEGAGTLDGSGTIRYLPTPPPDVRFNSLEHSKDIFVFREREAYELPEAVKVDIMKPGFVDGPDDYSPGTIPKGVEVDCFFVHFDSPGRQSATTSGRITVRGRIIGIIVEDRGLDDTDSVLGAEGTQYSTGQGARGFEKGAEKITLTDDQKTIEIHQFKITFPGEEMRILTVPGGFTSYGWNNQVPHKSFGPGSQIMLAEYEKSIVDVDFTNGNNDDLAQWLATRHYGKANILFCDGHIELVDKTELNPKRYIWKRDPEDGIR